MKVELYTSAGIAPRNLAHAAEVPPFITGAPEVVLWGIRVFKLVKPLPASREDTHKYIETFAYTIPYLHHQGPRK